LISLCINLNQPSIYKASIARAAAPSRPAALVAWGAPPVNCETVEEGLADAVELPVAEAAIDEARDATDEAAEATADDAEAAWDEATDAALDAALGAALETTLAAAEVALATAEEAAPEASGIWMGAPASRHVFWTAAMVAAWSAAEHAFRTQGCTEERRLAPF
jgi:chemotaxis protein histidine kinase CheA